ncbi:unnamed protein product [Vitrella brassicaformis CCMP3155]|uniref:GH16 domain-containing protein n=2 Tax=Vitrella brassicaformis TaxID=1169539 RepID=A0A0G4EUC3_VITBC|nr:unnamed protein product [Vitrella brassicaformis CCMP3155]|eukprot:CEM01690.1 unnamed protein product [Vitrella brassicaformis CCMP3155]
MKTVAVIALLALGGLAQAADHLSRSAAGGRERQLRAPVATVTSKKELFEALLKNPKAEIDFKPSGGAASKQEAHGSVADDEQKQQQQQKQDSTEVNTEQINPIPGDIEDINEVVQDDDVVLANEAEAEQPPAAAEEEEKEPAQDTQAANGPPAPPPLLPTCHCTLPGGEGTCTGECGRDYASGEVASHELFLYGRFETRMYPNIYHNGTLATFFLYKNESDKIAGENWAEIDFEVHGGGAHPFAPIQTNLITGTPEERMLAEEFFPAPEIPKAVQGTYVRGRFHIFTIEWTPAYIAWFIDGFQIRRETACPAWGKPPNSKCNPQVNALNEPMNLRASHWPLEPHPAVSPWAEYWAGIFDDTSKAALPAGPYYDWIRTYTYDNETSSFVFHWQEDFDGPGVNRKRWEVAKHTYSLNHAQFNASNVFITEPGHLALVLSERGDTHKPKKAVEKKLPDEIVEIPTDEDDKTRPGKGGPSKKKKGPKKTKLPGKPGKTGKGASAADIAAEMVEGYAQAATNGETTRQ